MNISLTSKIWEYCEGKLINGHDQAAMLELHYEKLKTFMEKLKDSQISQGFFFFFFGMLIEAILA